MTEAASTRADVRARIIEAAALLLQEDGAAAVTTRAVAQGAGVQPPTIYRLFGDKDGLLEAVAEHVMATYVSAKAAVVDEAAAADLDPLADLRSGWESQLDFGLANPDLFRLLAGSGHASPSPALESGRRVLAARVHRLAETGRLQVSEQRAVGLIQAAGTGVVQTLLSTPTDERDPGLADDMYDALLRQLLSDAPPREQSGARGAAVALRAMAPGLEVLSDGERLLLSEWLSRVIETGETA